MSTCQINPHQQLMPVELEKLECYQGCVMQFGAVRSDEMLIVV
jgi:hypothetical protein